MTETLVLLHGAAMGSGSWNPILKAITAAGMTAFAPDLLGYGHSPPAPERYRLDNEVAHVAGLLKSHEFASVHLVAHSLGALVALHLRPVLGSRVTRLTLVEPIVVSVLREKQEREAYAEMEEQYQRFMQLAPDREAAARFFVDHWSGPGVWNSMPSHGRASIAKLVPKLAQEMIATRSDETPWVQLTEAPPPTTILIGEKTLLAPRAVARQLEGPFGAKTIIVPGAGHMIPLTHPQEVLGVILPQVASAS